MLFFLEIAENYECKSQKMLDNKYLQFFNYLKAFYQLKERQVRNIEKATSKYHFNITTDQLWQTKGLNSLFLDFEKKKEEAILVLKRPQKPKAPDLPNIPLSIKSWLNHITLDPYKTPTLKESNELEFKTIHLGDHPEVQQAYSDWLPKYEDWSKKQIKFLVKKKQYKHDQGLYSKLFDAQAKLRNFSERFELVLQIGVFSYSEKYKKKDEVLNREYKYPILFTSLQIEMDEKGTLEILLKPSDDLFTIQTDGFNNLTKLEFPKAIATLKDFLNDQSEEDLQTQLIALRNSGLNQFANQLGSTVEYQNQIEFPKSSSDQMIISFSPVISLKNRSVRNFTALFESIIEAFKNTPPENIPLLDRLISNQNTSALAQNGHHLAATKVLTPVIFPKKSNEEQVNIAREVARRKVVVVQGPPGTGKSHTIANIICLLLSEGKRILVTAQTDQALRALKNHIPTEFMDLVIYFLSDQSTRKNSDLKKSIRKLQNSINHFEPDMVSHKIEKAHNEITKIQTKQEKLLEKIRLKSNEDQLDCELNVRYKDQNLADLALRIRQEEEQFGWFKEEVYNLNVTLKRTELLLEWFQLWSKTVNIDSSAIGSLDISQLITPDDFENFLELKEEINIDAQLHNLRIPLKQLNQWEQKLDTLELLLIKKTSLYHPADKIFGKIRERSIVAWRSLSATSKDLVSKIKALDLYEITRNYVVEFPEKINKIKLKADAKEILDYVNEGKKLKSGIQGLLLPASIRARNYIYKNCTINGYPCKSVQQLETLIKYTKILLHFLELDERWGEFAITETNLIYKLEDYETLISEFDTLLDIAKPLINLANDFSHNLSIPIETVENGKCIPELKREIQSLKQVRRLKSTNKKLKEQQKFISSLQDIPDLAQKLLSAQVNLDIDKYGKVFRTWQELTELLKLKTSALEIEEEIAPYFEATIKALKENTLAIEQLDLEVLRDAVFWSHAKIGLRKKFENSLEQLYQELADIGNSERMEATALLKNQALEKFMSRIGYADKLNEYLTRWQQAVTKASGRGKSAYLFSRESQKILKSISQKIPCWIMPIYKLADTLGPEAEVFDVVIIDEASQLGPEALFLTYITKQIIVVGDDHQTAPENVGIDEEKVRNLIREHLDGIPNKHFFDTNHSFFDHMKTLSGRQITLREHFRCVPQIIGFSNQLCYEPEGISLIPLKQQPLNGIKPLKTVYLPSGKRENDINEEEAKAILNTIQLYLQDEKYKDKSMGIITLHGRKQHVLIDKLIRDKIPPAEITKRKIVVGVPPDFQGDERDIIFLSMVISPDTQFNALTKVSFRRRFNVAMSRAKEKVVLFHSVTLEELQPYDFRYQLLHYFRNKQIKAHKDFKIEFPDDRRYTKPPKPFDSWFEVDIYQEIRIRKYRVIPQYKVGPYRIDLVVELKDVNCRIAIECDGDIYHNGENLERDIQRQLVLERAGWEFFRIRYSHYRYFPEEALAGLWKLLKKRKLGTETINLL
jgi:very-short-patch-repair endonuclease/energy-coupling factor transporter ATP-binding protein EcfA2